MIILNESLIWDCLDNKQLIGIQDDTDDFDP